MEAALELKARSLLFLRRFREVADMLQDYIPSYKADDGAGDDDSTSSSLGAAGDHSMASSAPLIRERANLLSPGRERSDGDRSFRCFSVSNLKRRVSAGMSKSSDREGQWRYLVLGQACCHLGMMENARQVNVSPWALSGASPCAGRTIASVAIVASPDGVHLLPPLSHQTNSFFFYKYNNGSIIYVDDILFTDND